MTESDVLLSSSVLTGGPTASELALNDMQVCARLRLQPLSSCFESQVCAACRDHGSHTCVLAGSCLQVSDNDDAEQEVEVCHREGLLTVFERMPFF